jgi:hypothetical protein
MCTQKNFEGIAFQIPPQFGRKISKIGQTFLCLLTVHLSITLVLNLLHKFLFYNKFIICLYMFRALCAHHQEVKIVLKGMWYHHTCSWPSRAQFCPPDDEHVVLETCRGI